MFLTEKEVAELTGIYRGSGGLTNHQLQAAQLRKMGIPFWVNARGLPKVVRETLTGATPPKAKAAPTKWEMPTQP